jgi:hypothetical protein
MTKYNLLQKKIRDTEEQLKQDFGYTSAMLEQIGIDSTSAGEYLINLEDTLQEKLNNKD